MLITRARLNRLKTNEPVGELLTVSIIQLNAVLTLKK